MKTPFYLPALLLFWACTSSETNYPDVPPQPVALETHPSPEYLTAEESMKHFHLPEGYRLELVADEHMLNEPVTLAWDGNGKMYVAEMCTYMQDADGTGTQEAKGRISLLEDTDGDGKMDKHTVFIDSLVLPRMILPLDDRLLVNETYTYDIHSYRDTDHDGKADEKKLMFHSDEVDNRNLEHQASGLLWNLDNWIYLARNPIRFKYAGDHLTVDSLLDAPQGQWGLTADDYGRLFYSNAGGETPATGFQLNPAYGTIEMNDQFTAEFEEVWPIIATPDVQGGTERLRPDSTLNHFTASCGQSIFQGDRLPGYLKGDLFICEPVGRLIRRAKVTNKNGEIYLENAYHKQEFIASTDMNFRPVNTFTGPDGCLYIVDMYRGIIQESNWTRKGSFLRPVIERLGLDKNFGRGRIYRLVHQGFKRGPQPDLLNASIENLIDHLAHPNGWWRSTAQKLLILRNNSAAIPALKALAMDDQIRDPLPRLHALWTLQGMNALESKTLLNILLSPDAHIRRHAIWLSEDLLRKNDTAILNALVSLKNNTSADVKLQLLSSLRHSKSDLARQTILEMKTANRDNKLLVLAADKSIRANTPVPDDIRKLRSEIAARSPENRELILKGVVIFKQLCATCHGPDGKGVLTKSGQRIAPPLDGSPRVQGPKPVITRILLQGLTGPIDGKKYPDIMASMAANDDEWIASVLTYVRYRFGNNSSTVWPDNVEEVRKETANRNSYWTLGELEALAPNK